MSARPKRRRSAGEGGVYPYMTKAGLRYQVKGTVRMPDGTLRRIERRQGYAGERWTTEQEALAWLHDQQAAGRKGEFAVPSSDKFGAYCYEVIDSMRIAPSTRASYRKNVRNHVDGYPIARLALRQLSGTKLSAHYRVLEKSGRKDHRAGQGLSPRTVRYLSQILHKVLGQAVKDGLLARNPADAASPPTAKEAKAPEMRVWTAAQLSLFLRWSKDNSANHDLWEYLAKTGKRRGEAVAARYRDMDFDKRMVSVRRSAGLIRNAGEDVAIVEGDTKSGKPRVIDLDDDVVSTVRTHRRRRGALALQLAQDDALIWGDLEGNVRNPEHVSRQFNRDVQRCRAEVGEDAPPMIRLHDLRHTHATILLTAGIPVHVVSERLGHASAVVTMTVYAHVLPGSQREAADAFARIIREASA